MKTIMAVASIITLSIATQARPISFDEDHCLSVSYAAMTTMEIRQSYNFSLDLVLKAVEGDALVEYLVLEAYDVPKHLEKEHQLEATAQFGKRMLSECLDIE